ncbi:hypothetical protein ACQ4PT_029736 [Festuca glaucescens]
MEHNGFFCGIGKRLQYASPTVSYIDYCNKDTWSLLWIEDILKQLGYAIDEKLHVYWCLPGKDISEGLVLIKSDADIVQMIKAADNHKTLCLMIDHSDFLKKLREDAIVNRGQQVPPVTCQNKNITRDVSAGEGASKSVEDDFVNFYKDFCQEEEAEDSDDSDFVDSDFEVEEGDDDLFRDNVDTEVNDNNEVVQVQDLEDDDALEDADLNLRRERQEKLKYKFGTFNPQVDMDNPIFKVGMEFSDVNEFRAALNSYSVRNRKKINKTRNEKIRVNACCEEGCPWMIKASKNSMTGAFVVKGYEGKHTCESVWKLKTLTAPFLTQKFLDEFRDNMKMDLQTFANKVQREYNMCPDRWKLGRARKDALTIIHGDEAAQFNQLWDYGQELRRSNPGSKFFLTCNKVKVGDKTEDHLATLYWSYDALKRGFLRGCRPLICVDGCHIKTRYKGQLLTVVGIDPNDCIYPITFGLVEVECTSSWEWFLTTLRDDLNITNTSPWTIISDKQKGLIKAVTKVFPDAEHRFCVRHLYQNFQKAGHKGEVLKNNLWAIARSTCVPKWQHNMDKMKAASQQAYEWVEELVPNTWIKAFFSDFSKCDMLLNNHSEVFNSYILQAIEMVILSMLETIFYKLMLRVERHDKYIASVQVEQDETMQPEDEFFDDPSYIQNIIPQNISGTLDPMHQQNSMVFKLGIEERAHFPPTRTHGPLPQESSFVQSARDSIPAATVRITTASSRGNLRGRGRGRTSRAHVPDDGQQATRGRGKGTRKRRSDASASTTEVVDGDIIRGRGRATRRASYNTGTGSAHYMLSGDDEQQRAAIPDLNAFVPVHNGEEEEVVVTQNAPDQEDR